MLVSCIYSFKEILSSKRYKSITNFPSSHNKKSGYFKRDSLVVSIIENKKDQIILSITEKKQHFVQNRYFQINDLAMLKYDTFLEPCINNLEVRMCMTTPEAKAWLQRSI